MLASAGLLVAVPGAGAEFVFERQFGPGTPRSLDLDSEGNVYVSSDGSRTITSFDPQGEQIDQWGGAWNGVGDGNGLFSLIEGIAVDATDGLLYATDGDPGHRIQKFSLTGQFFQKWGGPGAGEDQMNRPRGIDVDGFGNVYVADSFNHRVKSFSDVGALSFQYGSIGYDDGQFDTPSGLAIGPNGNAFVGDRAGFIREFNGGSFVRRFGGQDPTPIDGLDDGRFGADSGAVGLDVDHLGRIWAVDRDYDRVQVFRPDGTFLAKFGSSGSGAGQFDSPTDVAVDPGGSIYVADRNNDRVQVFRNEVLFPPEPPGPGPGPDPDPDPDPDPRAIPNNFSFGKQTRNLRRGFTVLRVRVPGPGRVALLNSKRNRKASVRSKAASTVKLKVRAKGKSARVLRRKGRLAIRVKVRYLPDGGTARTKPVKVRLARR